MMIDYFEMLSGQFTTTEEAIATAITVYKEAGRGLICVRITIRCGTK